MAEQGRPPQGPPGGGGGGASGGKGGKNKGRTFTITFTLPTLITALLAASFACLWIFFLGVILGTGHFPEDKIPRLGKLMPQNIPSVPTLLAADAPPPSAAEGARPAPSATQQKTGGTTPIEVETQEGPQVMGRQDFGFHEALKPKPNVTNSSPAKRSAKVEPGAQEKKTDAAKKKEQEAATKAAAKKAKEAEQAAAKAKADKKEANVFVYEFQVAAYKESAPAQAMADKLRRAGFTTTVEKTTEKGTMWFKSMVTFRGTPEEVDATLRPALKRQGVKSLVRKSKKPVNS